MIKEVADDVVLSFRSYQAIFMDALSIKRVTAEKQHRTDIVQDTSTKLTDNRDLLKEVISSIFAHLITRFYIKVNTVSMTNFFE